MTKRNATKGKDIRICPKCGSINVHIDFSNPVVWDYGTPVKYKCNKCSYTSSLFPDIPRKDIKKYRNKIIHQVKEGKVKYNKEDFIDTSSGFAIGIWESIIFIFSLLFILVLYYIGKDISLISVFIWVLPGLLIVYLVWRNYANRKIK